MEFQLITTQSALDESRAQYDWTICKNQQELEARAQEIANLKEQVANLQSINTTLIGHTQFLKNQLDFMEATMGEGTDDSQSATHSPVNEDLEMEEDPEEPIFIDDE
jgi:hypothetical protein